MKFASFLLVAGLLATGCMGTKDFRCPLKKDDAKTAAAVKGDVKPAPAPVTADEVTETNYRDKAKALQAEIDNDSQSNQPAAQPPVKH